MDTTCLSVGTRREDMEQSRAWTARFLSGPDVVPISFVFDGKLIREIPADWNPSSRKRRVDANLVETVFEGREAQSGLSLRIECLEYADYPVVGWTAWLTNDGKQPTPIISDLLAMDGAFEGTSPSIYHCNGDFASADGYTPRRLLCARATRLLLHPKADTPAIMAFPYHRIMFKDCGLTLAIGWPAQWSASFTGLAGGVHVRAGQEKTHLRLMPGETIRTPRMTLMSWTGDATRAANRWRRWYRDRVTGTICWRGSLTARRSGGVSSRGSASRRRRRKPSL